MKKLFLFLLYFLTLSSSSKSYAQFGGSEYAMCAYIDGCWSSWDTWYTDIISLYGNYHSIAIYSKDRHPSQFYFRFTINNYTQPTEKEIKQHYKNNTWYEYSGTVEYYITDKYQTAKSQLLASGSSRFWIPPQQPGDVKPTVKKTSTATIKIAPFKKTPRCYNIYFDGVGFAIDLKNITFSYW